MDINYGYHFYVDISPAQTEPSWAEVSEGIENFDKSLNEVVNDFQFFSGQGWGSSEVTGGQLVLTLTGRRIRGDAAQDYIFNPASWYNFGDARKTRFKMTSPGGYQLIGPCTLANIDTSGGDSTDGTALTFEVRFNGKPTITPELGVLAVTSSAGSTTGTTALVVVPAKAAANIYKYKTDVSVTLPDYEGVTTGWTAWNGTSEVTATTGNEIAVVECLASGLAIKGGKTTVIANDG